MSATGTSLATGVHGLAADAPRERAGRVLAEAHRVGDVDLAYAHRLWAVGDRSGFGRGHAPKLAGGDINGAGKDDAGIAIDHKVRSADGAVGGHSRNRPINLATVAGPKTAREITGNHDAASAAAGDGASCAVLRGRVLRAARGGDAGNGSGEALLHLCADGSDLRLGESLGTL